ncbi:glycosyltransferase involved in cell wall biosynthesis [Dokdonia sp. Hel_I_63]|uniref:glycosyltransferase family 2 protein n=1 Tax=unclassified Dokdonia TaxID=2615033 RepID=UPI00020A6696|nr:MULTISPECIES: glycosyltransferase family A protein [unclassified Dokdonia]AEE20075.1 glycosyl transferase family 2 [Dokdonia sp. 4H-3-7-5]TVZ23670.1 glycosyltransferase involved in cell wall biosynthesis [Dokdonia sp. Hel_I_63]
MPKFSVVVPLYNKEKAIAQTIESIINQTFTDYEVIIVNDGSTDSSMDVVDRYSEHKFAIFSKKNEGVSTARNYAVSKAQGTYIAFLDADDLWEPDHLKELDNLTSKFPDAALYCAAYQKQYSLSFTRTIKTPLGDKPQGWQGYVDDYFHASLKGAVAWTSAVAVTKKIFHELNGFDTSITFGAGEDTDLWIRLALAYRIAYSNKVTATHILHSENRISNTTTKKRSFLDLDKYEPQVNEKPNLKKYLDINRYALSIHYKIAGDQLNFKKNSKKINPINLTTRQQFLLKMPKAIVITLKELQQFLIRHGIYLSAYM